MTPARRTNLRQVAVNTVVAVGGVCLLFRWPLACAAVMAALLADTLRTWRGMRDVGVAIAGCVCGVALELVATQAGLWRYAYPSLAGLPAWVPWLWPTFCIGLPRLAETLSPGPERRLPPTVTMLIGLAIVVIEIPLLAAFGNTQPWPLTAGLIALGAGAVGVAPSPRRLIVLMSGAGFGLACELLPVQLGIWTYPAFAASAMPPWLAPGYAVLGLAVVDLGQGLADLRAQGRPGPR